MLEAKPLLEFPDYDRPLVTGRGITMMPDERSISSSLCHRHSPSTTVRLIDDDEFRWTRMYPCVAPVAVNQSMLPVRHSSLDGRCWQ